jgi:transposase
VLIDHDNARVLDVLENREKTTLIAWLQQAKDAGLLGQLQEVTVDMWEGYTQAVQQVFAQQVRIVIDRFHVVKNFQQWLSDARQEIQRALPGEQRELLKGSRWLWTSNLENLSREKRKSFAALRRRFPQLKALFLHRQRLRRIFENRSLSVEQARQRLSGWIEKGRGRLKLRALEKFHQMLERWIQEIANYFVQRSSNGRTEGFNHGIRAILWRAYGMRNFPHFRLRVLHAFG